MLILNQRKSCDFVTVNVGYTKFRYIFPKNTILYKSTRGSSSILD